MVGQPGAVTRGGRQHQPRYRRTRIASNSLTGGTTVKGVGSALLALSNGSYVIGSSGTPAGLSGAVTVATGPTAGIVLAANSLTSASPGDFQSVALTALSNGNFVVSLPFWDNNGVVSAGAVTWVSASVDTGGQVTTANSLVGDETNEDVGSSVTALTNRQLRGGRPTVGHWECGQSGRRDMEERRSVDPWRGRPVEQPGRFVG